MIYGSVCSGIESASVAWEPLGWKPAFFSEIDPFARAVLTHRFPDVPLHGDFTTIQRGEYAEIDVLVGGTPCQSFSVAGLRGGMNDDRGNLALEFVRLADRLKPRYIVWENVPGVLSSNGGRDFGSLLGALDELGFGLAWRILDAQFFGVPQRRRRVFLVGCARGDRKRAEEILFDGDGVCRHSHARRKKGEVAPTLPSRSSAGGGFGTDFDCDGGLIASDSAVTVAGGDTSRINALTRHIASGVDENMARDGWLIAHTLRGEGFDASEDGTGRGTPLVPIAFDERQITSAENRSNPQPDAPCHTLHRGSPPAIAYGISCDAFDRSGEGKNGTAAERSGLGIVEELSPTLRAKRPNAVAQSLAVRRLMPVETERLQGFPDGWTDVPYRSKPAADGPRYKSHGNSMAVPCMAYIGRRIQAVEQAYA